MTYIGAYIESDQYSPLAEGQIRVFELQASTTSDPIVGRLVTQAIDGDPYEAVSYVWGDNNVRHNIVVQGATFSITTNLHAALTVLRHQLVSEDAGSLETPGPRVRRLWADAICINQKNLPERHAQVEQMARIFASASTVWAWLGWDEHKAGRRLTSDAMQFIPSFVKDLDAGLQDARILSFHDDLESLPEHLTHLSGKEQQEYAEQARHWEAVKHFFEIGYFHRTWIAQELGLAKRAVLFTATKGVAQTETDETPEREALRKKVQPSMDISYCDWPLIGSFVEFLDHWGASLVTHLGLLSWVAHHILMIWSTMPDGSFEHDFLTDLHWARILRVTDPRDRVYGLLGHPLAVNNAELVVHPDYTVTRGVAYTKLAVSLICQSSSLHAVSFVDHEEDPCEQLLTWQAGDDGRMPSWVPDWHSINRTTPMDYPIPAAQVGDTDIKLVGNIACTEGEPLMQLLARGWVVDEIAALSHRLETTDFPVTHLQREKVKPNPFWLDRVWAIIRPELGHSSPGQELELLESLSLALALGTCEEGQTPGKSKPYLTLAEHHKAFAAYVLTYHELWIAASEAPPGGRGFDLPNQSLFDSLTGTTKAELWKRSRGAVSDAFVESMTWPSMCRVIYRTKMGLVGSGSRIARKSDLVCRVRGAELFMTLRQVATPADQAKSKGVNEIDGEEYGIDITCVYVGPTVMPARMKESVVMGGAFREKTARFRIF